MNKRNLFIIGIAALIGVELFVGSKISSVPAKKQETSQIVQSNSTSSTETLIGKSAPDFSVTTLERKQFRLSDNKGKIVILFGMAGWCGTCIPEGKALTKIRKEYANKGVEIIGVAFTKGDNEDFMKEYKKIGGIDIPLALDTDKVAEKYGLIRLETTYIIDKTGKVVYKDEQTTSYEEYKKALDKLI